MSKFGASKLGGNFVKRNRYKMKDGDNVYRIIPAMGDLAEEGRWSVYYNVVFGFKTTDGKHRPFQSPQVKNNKKKMIEVPCAATDLINRLKGELDASKKAGNNEKAAQLAKIVGDYPVMGVYSLNNDHYVNVIDKQGNVGVLEIGHKAKLALDNEIKRIRESEGFDPLAPETGRFFNIRRTGRGLDTSVQVTVLKEKVNVPGHGVLEKDVVHVIDDALADRLLTQKDGKWIYKEAANLTALYQKPTAEEVAEIVATADILSGKSAAVDKILGKGKEEALAADTSTNATDTAAQDAADAQAATQAAAESQAKQAAEAAAKVVAPAAPPVVQETKAAAQPASTAASSSKTTAETMAAMSPDDFMKQMGINLG